MLIIGALHNIPRDFQHYVDVATYPHGIPIKTTYTGIAGVDYFLRFLVLAFISGPAGWDEGIRLQQIYFLLSFFSVISIWNLEACRERNVGKLVS